MTLLAFKPAVGFRGGPSFYTGSGVSNLVPDVFPIAINGRPYMVDLKSNEFAWGFEQRVRDSTDFSGVPGEAAINPGGLWRRSQASWHYGAGQTYADKAGGVDYRYNTSKGVNPWTVGQISLLNATKLSLSSANTNLYMTVCKSSGGTEYLYIADGNTLKYSTNPFAASPTWTSVTTGAPAGVAITHVESNGQTVFIGYTSNDIYSTSPGSASVSLFYPTSGTSGKTYTAFSYAKGNGFASVDQDLYVIGLGSGGHNVFYDNPDTTFRWVGAAGGQNAVYAAGYSGTHSLIYKLTIKDDGSFDVPVVALELPTGEVVSSIFGYLGYILIGTNKGVRFASTDQANNLVAGSLIPTTGPVYGFTADDRFVWYTYSNFDATSTGLGRLDLSVNTAINTPAYASDLMYTSTAVVQDVVTFDNKRIFSVSGVGIVAEDTSNKVVSGYLEMGKYTWGIQDPKFIAKVDLRGASIKGSVNTQLSLDGGTYTTIGTWSETYHPLSVDFTMTGSDEQAVDAQVKLILNRSATTTLGPTVTRASLRAYASPSRSQVWTVPVLLHNRVTIRNREYDVDVAYEKALLQGLLRVPQIVTYQEGDDSYSVTVEDLRWTPVNNPYNSREWEGTLLVTLRSVQD
jgi:hypothetical protein